MPYLVVEQGKRACHDGGINIIVLMPLPFCSFHLSGLIIERNRNRTITPHKRPTIFQDMLLILKYLLVTVLSMETTVAISCVVDEENASFLPPLSHRL